MAGIIYPGTRLTKPSGRITIDGNTSLSNAIVGLWAFTNPTDYRNLVTGVMGTIGGDFPGTSFGIIGGQGGIGWSTPHAGQAMVDTGGSVVTDGAPTSIFACAHVSQLPPANWVYSAFSNQAVSSTGLDLQFGNGFGSSSSLYATGSPGDATTAWCDGAKDPTVNPLTNAVLVPNRVTVLAASYAAAYTHSKNIEIGRPVSGVVGYFAGTIYIVGAWNRQITDSEGAWVTHSPYDLIKPDIRRTYYVTAAQVTAGSGIVTGVGASDGVGTAAGVGAATAAGVGAGVGTGTALGVGSFTLAATTGVGNAAGTGTAAGVGAATAAGIGNAAGTGTALATGAAIGIISAVGNAAGTSVALGVSPTLLGGGEAGRGGKGGRARRKRITWLPADYDIETGEPRVPIAAEPAPIQPLSVQLTKGERKVARLLAQYRGRDDDVAERARAQLEALRAAEDGALARFIARQQALDVQRRAAAAIAAEDDDAVVAFMRWMMSQ